MKYLRKDKQNYKINLFTFNFVKLKVFNLIFKLFSISLNIEKRD